MDQEVARPTATRHRAPATVTVAGTVLDRARADRPVSVEEVTVRTEVPAIPLTDADPTGTGRPEPTATATGPAARVTEVSTADAGIGPAVVAIGPVATEVTLTSLEVTEDTAAGQPVTIRPVDTVEGTPPTPADPASTRPSTIPRSPRDPAGDPGVADTEAGSPRAPAKNQ
jgi:hypothetical protein